MKSLILGVGAFFLGMGTSGSARPIPERVRNVVIVIWGGVRRSDTIDHRHHLYIDNFWNRIRPHGTLISDVHNAGQTFPLPSQAAILTGRWMVFDPPERSTVPLAYPTLFEYWRSARSEPEERCVFAMGKQRLQVLAFSTASRYGVDFKPTVLVRDDPTTPENSIYEKFVAWFTEHKPSFVVLSLGSGEPIGQHAKAEDCATAPQVDACGGEVSLNVYYESIILMDNILYDLWHRIQEDPVYRGSTLFVVTSDHGRHSKDYSSYGDQCPGCSRTFMFFSGPGVRSGVLSRKKRQLIDLCPTVGVAAGFATPYAQGTVMSEIFSR